ncbi:para-aminobenzoate synthetase component 1 [Saccharopolyspora erythraea NRRL 2338]|uniref:Para-aminobenzoate synthetase component I n=1 Tax=Saccharopolyspora erythraea (strain ATCC 11635 / DSM 40517 / JCM 4748 / NBRC 13426 / NCIMB 8594 / NRRL 2338) TaxID=405948 RepID=A4F7W0_SACEN|nr:para-aminobenzoate synthetase component 1 [Saccharopolyspora erythraea NRRL 2338]CAM00134.1 para-aminobenzoate synthetase component I [Saccharopolyspora erythraea NRRL 2338]
MLRRLSDRARQRGLPPPAALTGDWFGGGAVLVPSVSIGPQDDPFAVLDAFDSEDAASTADVPEGAVGGGWIGYLGYGLTDPGRHAQPRRLPLSAWGWTDHVLRRDREGQWWFESLGPADPALVDELTALVSDADLGSPSAPGSSTDLASPQHSQWQVGPVRQPDADLHRKAVRGCVEQIAAGEIFQANICSRFAVPFTGDPLEVFAAGSERFRPARAAYVAGDWGAVASLSPELFLARSGDVVHSSPIKGTLPRRGPQDDANAELLRASAKDVAENVMIVDMARNDLGRVASTGRVTVPKLLDVQPHPGVWHLVSDVRAEVPAGLSNSRLLEATFPPASVTGAPKVRALEVIGELEDVARDVYCGAVGMVSPAAGLELNVAIRTLEYSNGMLHLGVGGGITADSDPEREWQECLTKAAPLLSLLRSGTSQQSTDTATASTC